MELIEIKKRTLKVTRNALIRVEINDNIASITFKDFESEISIDFESEDFNFFYEKCRHTVNTYSASKREKKKK